MSVSDRSLVQTGDTMRKASVLILAFFLLSSCGRRVRTATPPSPPPVPTYVFWLTGSDLNSHSLVSAIGATQQRGEKITGAVTFNYGGHVCNARISGVAKTTPDGGQDITATYTSTNGSSCPGPLKFHSVPSRSYNPIIEIDSTMAMSGFSWVQ